jgi:hypothetical protein
LEAVGMNQDLQRWLALEHEAVWQYGLIGGRFDGLRDHAETAWQEHRATRDHLTALISSAGQRPVGPAMSYGSPAPTAAQARAVARDVEQRVAAAALAALGVAAKESEGRFAVARVRAAARAAITWGDQPGAFPGLVSSRRLGR